MMVIVWGVFLRGLARARAARTNLMFDVVWVDVCLMRMVD